MQGDMQREPARLGPRRAPRRLFGGYDRDPRLFIIESMLINSANVITGGAFLTGLLVLMKASNLVIALVTGSGTWSLMLSILSSLVVERAKSKKKLLTGVLLAFRLLTTLPVFLPALMGAGAPSAVATAVMMIAGNAIFSLFNTGFPVFFMASLPEDGRSAYIYNRMQYLRIAYTLASVAMGLLLDAMRKSYLGFVIVFSLGLVIGIADVFVFVMIRGKEDAPVAHSLPGVARHLFEPFKNTKYLRFLLFTFVYFVFFFSGSNYTQLYLQRYLNLSFLTITVYTTCIYAVMIALTQTWARRERSRGSVNVLVLTSLLLPLDQIIYSLLTGRSLWMLGFSVLFNGAACSGLWACILPYRYSLMPEEGRAVYEGWYCFLFGAANLLGAFLGNCVQQALPGFHIGALAVSSYQVLFFCAGLLSLAAAVAFALSVRKDGPQEED